MFVRLKPTLKLYDLLRGVNDEIAYTAITEHMDMDMAELRPLLYRVRRYMERDDGIVFETIRGLGLRRMDESEKVQSLTEFRRKIHVTAGRGIMRSATVYNPETLDNEEQMKLTIHRTIFESVRRSTNNDKGG